jgi:hypothetical protein
MPIDAGIYNVLNTKAPEQISNAFSFTPMDAMLQGKLAKNKLASLVQEQEMRSIQLDEAKGRQFFQQHLQTALEHSGGDLRKARDFAFQSGHPEGVAWAQQADKFIKEQEAKDRQNQFGDVVNSIGQPSVTSNQTEMLMQGGGNPSYTSMPETPEQRQQKMLKMLSINPEAGAQVAGVLNKPEEFRMKQAEARQARQDAFAQQENMARLVAGLKPAKEETSKPPAGYRFTVNGDLQAIPGGPADIKEQAKSSAQETGRSNVSSTIAQLRDAYSQLNQGGGITDPNAGVVHNLVAGLGSSGAGQLTGRMLGTQNQSKRNEILMTRPSLLQHIMKATGMSAKQMDSNAELKLWLSTATDPTLDISANMNALDNIERVYGLSGGQGKVVEPTGNPHAHKTDAQIKAELGL